LSATVLVRRQGARLLHVAKYAVTQIGVAAPRLVMLARPVRYRHPGSLFKSVNGRLGLVSDARTSDPPQDSGASQPPRAVDHQTQSSLENSCLEILAPK